MTTKQERFNKKGEGVCPFVSATGLYKKAKVVARLSCRRRLLVLISANLEEK